MSDLIHIEFYAHAGIAARKNSRSGIAGFDRWCQFTLHRSGASSHPYLPCVRGPVCPHPPQLSVVSNLLIFVNLIDEKSCFCVVLNCLSLMSEVHFSNVYESLVLFLLQTICSYLLPLILLGG